MYTLNIYFIHRSKACAGGGVKPRPLHELWLNFEIRVFMKKYYLIIMKKKKQYY